MIRLAALPLAVAAAAAAISATSAAFSSATANADSAFATAASFCEGGTQTLSASADAYVDSALLAQGSNFGTATQLHVRSDTLGNRRTLVRFALPAVPPYCTVTSALLRLNASSGSNGRTLEAVRVAGAWTEIGVTWSNQPATTGTAITASSGTGWREWSVTAHVQAMYSGTNHGWLVADASEGALLAASQAFSSREAASNVPELVVSFG